MITLREVKKTVENFNFGPFTLQIDKGNVTAIVGNNGAGKSTLFHLMMGYIKLDDGKITYENDDWKRDVAYVPQTSTIYEGFTLMQLKELFQLTYGAWDDDEFARLTKLFQLPLDKKLEKLSVGTQKKALLTIALCRPSKLLLLDEPFAGVDLRGQEQLKNEWIRYMERSDEQTIVFATHSADEVKTLADFIVLIKDGTCCGKYEKDGLLSSWRSVWVEIDPERALQIPGVKTCAKQGRWTYCLTENIERTERFLSENGIHIEKEQRLELNEILTYMLDD